MFRAPSNPT
jgi:hypothetical protein